MIDKQIIVDGVDVSKCNYFSFTDELYCDECSSEFGCASCDERPNCCYKQLKRKEQTLNKIKDIAEHCTKQDICTTCNYSEKCHIEDEEIPTYDVCKLILQKISEVKNES